MGSMKKVPAGVILDGRELNARSDTMNVKCLIVTTTAIALMVNASAQEAIRANFVSKVSRRAHYVGKA